LKNISVVHDGDGLGGAVNEPLKEEEAKYKNKNRENCGES
jgi:hypothetical protein